MSEIHGFSFLRNAVQYDYPFRESIRSLASLCNSVTLALGDSEDSTSQEIAELSSLPIEVVSTKWDEDNRKSGIELSVQTNIALDHVRRNKKGWAFYLQGDEVLHEREIEQIKGDLSQAELEGFDAVRFRYLHFWQSHDRLAIGRFWYPQEIRAIRMDSKIQSYGDAQSFEGATKVFESDAHIFHYGHVREKSAYEKKKTDFHRWWHPDSEIQKVIARGKKVDSQQKTTPYLGSHPRVMESRIGRKESGRRERLIVYGNQDDWSSEFVGRIQAKQILWDPNAIHVKGAEKSDTVAFRPLSFWENLKTGFKYSSKVPQSMLSPQARPWKREFVAMLRLSEKGFEVV